MEKHLQTKPFQETLHKSLCGPASLKIVLNFYGNERTEDDLAALCNWNESYGVDDVDIRQAAESLGYKVEILNKSTLEDIKKWLEKGIPVIVNWFTTGRSDYSENEVADGHYSVVEGMDENHIYLQDPEIGGVRKLLKQDFLRVWFDFSGDSVSPETLIIRQIIAIYN